MIGRMPPEKAAKTKAAVEKIQEMAANTEGVFLRGRIAQEKLALEMLEAKALFYPTMFEETSCITVMEAQAAACTPITTALGALVETVHHGFLVKLTSGEKPQLEQPQLDKFVDRAVWCLTDEVAQPRLASKGRKEALAFHPWDNVAKEWEEIICDKLAEIS